MHSGPRQRLAGGPRKSQHRNPVAHASCALGWGQEDGGGCRRGICGSCTHPGIPGGSRDQDTMRRVHLGPVRGRLGDSRPFSACQISSSVYMDKGRCLLGVPRRALATASAQERETAAAGGPSPAGVTGDTLTVSSHHCHLQDHLQGPRESPTEGGAAEGLSQETAVATTTRSFW